ncbi:MAG: hypothetical protein PUF03_07990 [Lachnospiraceae bacterium]|nr:hypothetical protein [Lachnospiraceae bacterium]
MLRLMECIGDYSELKNASGTYYNEPGYSEFVNECAYMNEIKEFFEVVRGKQPEYTMEKDAQILRTIDEIEKISHMGYRNE